MTLQDMIDCEKKESFEDGVALGRSEGREEGKAEARKEGIMAFVNFAKEMRVPSDEIANQLMQKFSLPSEEAKAYLDNN